MLVALFGMILSSQYEISILYAGNIISDQPTHAVQHQMLKSLLEYQKHTKPWQINTQSYNSEHTIGCVPN